MTIAQAVARFDLLYPNAFPYTEKRGWLSALDGMAYSDIISLYKGAPEGFSGYGQEEAGDTELLIGFPYDDLYIKYMCMQGDITNSDIGRYNNSAALFSFEFSRFAAAYNRTHELKSRTRLGEVYGGVLSEA